MIYSTDTKFREIMRYTKYKLIPSESIEITRKKIRQLVNQNLQKALESEKLLFVEQLRFEE